MKLRLLALIVVVLTVSLGLSARQWRPDDVVNPHLADSTQFVANPDGVLGADAVNHLNQRLRKLQRLTTSEMAVVALDSIDPSTDIDRFATVLFNKWGLGKNDTDNGVLLLLARSSHEVTIRTGRGSEAVVPDILAGRIIRNKMIPHFRNDRYDEGVIAGTDAVYELMTTPGATEEMMSDHANNMGPDSRSADGGIDSLFTFYLWGAVAAGIIMLVVVVWTILSTARLDDVSRYRALERLSTTALFMVFLGLALPLPAYLILKWKMKRLRNHPRDCRECGTRMTRLNEEADNAYLTPAQDAEERLNSVDYDVWLCPKCSATEVIPYVNRSSAYTQCPHCHARAMSLLNSRTTKQPTPISEGAGVRTYSCRHCGFSRQERYSIPKIVVVPAGRRRGGGGGFGGFGGGGFGGGSFGGGSSLGGGATGRW